MMDVSMRRQLVLALAASLTACGGGADQTSLSGNKVIDSSNTPQPPPPAPPPPPPAPAPAPAPTPGPGDPIVTSYSAAASGVTPALEGGSIAHGGDGALWFSGGFVPNQIGRMTSAGAVSYPVTRAAGLVSFNPGPLARGPDGNIWFADPLAGIDIAGTIGTVDIATNVASEYATPLMKTTIQISLRTVAGPVVRHRHRRLHAGADRHLRPRRTGPAGGAGHSGVGADPGGAADSRVPRQHLPHGDDRADARSRLHADRADARQRLHDDDLPDDHHRPDERHHLQPGRSGRGQLVHPHRLHRHHAGLAGLQDHHRSRRQPLVHRVQRHAGRQVRRHDQARHRVRPAAGAGDVDRQPAPTATSGSPSAAPTARPRCSAGSRRPA